MSDDHLVDRHGPPLLPEEKRDEHDPREKSSRQMGKKKEDTRAEVSYQELSRAEHPFVTRIAHSRHMLLTDHRRRDKTRNLYENGTNTKIVSFEKHDFFLVDDKNFGAEKFKYFNTEIN